MAEDKTKRIRELIGTLRAAGRAYYQESREIMSNFEYDKLYDELVSLEETRRELCLRTARRRM